MELCNQFGFTILLQPPGLPQMHRFFSGGSSNNHSVELLSQGNHLYEFHWLR
jgi:hypothetical protein